MSIGTLGSKQNPDGGWPYVRGGSWTEPTVYAVLALFRTGEVAAARRGIQWIRGMQRRDGGWAPRAEVDQSTWVTGLVALLPPEELGVGRHRRAIEWLLGAEGRESTRMYLLREWLLGVPKPAKPQFPGWPWMPGTAAWVGPTSIAIMALETELQRNPSDAIRSRIHEGRNFLLARMCRGGGWNHGASNALGYAAQPYPETTGMALAAFKGCRHPLIDQSVEVALGFLEECRSRDAMNWLRLGLRAHGRLPAGFCPPADLALRTVPEASMDTLISSAEQEGRDPFAILV